MVSKSLIGGKSAQAARIIAMNRRGLKREFKKDTLSTHEFIEAAQSSSDESSVFLKLDQIGQI